MKKIILLSALLVMGKNFYCQIKPLQVGDTLPDFLLGNIYNYKEPSLDLNEIKNKVILIDFWNTRCGGLPEAVS